MNFSPEQFEDYKNRCLSFRETTLDCIPLLTQTGELILKQYRGETTPRHWVFCFDMIKRIRENLSFLVSSNPPQENNSIPLRLILRSVFSDLITLSYVVENINNKNALSSFLHLNDISAVDGKNTFAECEKEFLELCGKKEWSGFLDSRMVDFAQVKDEILAPYGGAMGNLKRSTLPQTKQIAVFFRNSQNLKPLYALLYGPFKMLSQVEHYANENRSYSYFDVNTAFFFQKFALHYKQVIIYLHQNITDIISNRGCCGNAAGLS